MEFTAHQVSCLARPATSRVLSAVRSLGKASAADIAATIGKSPATCQYHLRKLEEVGLVHIDEIRPTARRPEAVYRPNADHWSLPSGDIEVDQAFSRAVSASVREALREFNSAPGHNQKHVLKRQMRLDHDHVEQFLALLEDAAQFAADHHSETGTVEYHWFSLAYPRNQGTKPRH